MSKACDGVEIAWDAKNPYFAKVYTRTADHIDSITKTTRADVMRVISNGYDQGKSIPEVAADIRATIRASSPGRALTIARTEMNRFQNGAALSAAQVVGKAAGVGYQKRWLTAPGAEHPRHEDYEGLDGQTVGIDEMFDVGGNEFQYPGDPDGDPGDSINCRCSIEFVEAGGQLADIPVPDEMLAADGVTSVAGLESPVMDALTAGASGSTDLPLSERDAAWDAGAAEKSLGAGDFGKAHFWKNGSKPADQIGSYKLPFASKGGGSLTAVWKGVTSAAGAVQGARGGVSIPSGDVPGVKSKIGSYYAKAKKQYKDDAIKVPWSLDGEEPLTIEEMSDRLAHAESLAGDDYNERLGFWMNEFADNMDKCANCSHYASAHAGGDNMGACSMDNCDCAGFEAAAAETEEAEAQTEELTLSAFGYPLPGMMQIVFNGVNYTATTSNTLSSFANYTLSATNNAYHEDDLAAAAVDEVEIPEEHQPADVQPEANGAEANVELPQARTNAAETPYHVILAPEGKATDDGRVFAPGSIGWRDLPLSLMAMTETPGEGGHAGAELCGKIDSIYRNDSGKPILIEGDGTFEDSPFGHDIAAKVEDGYLTGNSVDLAVLAAKLVMRDDVVDEDGFWLDGVDIDEVDAVSIIDLFFGDVEGEVLHVITEAKIGMSTVCPFPAFAEATISVTADGREQKWTIFQGILPHLETVHVHDAFQIKHADDGLTASAAGMVPLVPPREWFNDPELDELTPLTVTDEGRVYGHAWPWGECHISFQSDCTIAPHTQTGYAYYLLKECETDDGCVEVGTITLDTSHAGKHLSWREAAAHYDNTGTAVADVTFGEDEHGGWFSGALRPDVSAEAVRKFRGASVSGDWRRIRGNLELVGLLTVNVPGFPVPRTRALVAAGEGEAEILTLVAAGVIGRAEETAEITEADKQILAAFASGDMAELKTLADEARE